MCGQPYIWHCPPVVVRASLILGPRQLTWKDMMYYLQFPHQKALYLKFLTEYSPQYASFTTGHIPNTVFGGVITISIAQQWLEHH